MLKKLHLFGPVSLALFGTSSSHGSLDGLLLQLNHGVDLSLPRSRGGEGLREVVGGVGQDLDCAAGAMESSTARRSQLEQSISQTFLDELLVRNAFSLL